MIPHLVLVDSKEGMNLTPSVPQIEQTHTIIHISTEAELIDDRKSHCVEILGNIDSHYSCTLCNRCVWRFTQHAKLAATHFHAFTRLTHLSWIHHRSLSLNWLPSRISAQGTDEWKIRSSWWPRGRLWSPGSFVITLCNSSLHAGQLQVLLNRDLQGIKLDKSEIYGKKKPKFCQKFNHEERRWHKLRNTSVHV